MWLGGAIVKGWKRAFADTCGWCLLFDVQAGCTISRRKTWRRWLQGCLLRNPIILIASFPAITL